MTKLTAGEVEIDLNGEPTILKPSLAAAMNVSSYFGGFRPAFDRLAAFDLDACIRIVREGTGASGAEAAAQAEKVFRAGAVHLAGPLSRYVGNLSRGGRELTDIGDDKGTAAGNGPS